MYYVSCVVTFSMHRHTIEKVPDFIHVDLKVGYLQSINRSIKLTTGRVGMEGENDTDK